MDKKTATVQVDEVAHLLRDDRVDGLDVAREGMQSPMHVFFNILKAVVGAGSFALPLAFEKGGFWGSIIGLILLCLLSDYTMKVLVRTKVFLNVDGSYPDLVRAALPKPWNKYVAGLVYGMIVVTVLGACTVYLVFCGKLLTSLVPHVAIDVWIIIMSVVLAIVSWVPNLKEVAFLSLMGDIALLVAMVVVLYYGATHFELQPLNHYPAVNWGTLSQFYGPVVFLFGIHMLIVPLHSQMADPSKFERTLDVSMLVVLVANMAFGLFSYMLYYKVGTNIASPITDGLKPEPGYDIIEHVAQVALIGDLLFTFSIVFVAGRDVVETSLVKPYHEDKSVGTHLKRMAIRSFMVFFCAGIAIALKDDFASLISLISGLTFSSLCFVFPPILYLCSLWKAEYEAAKHSTLRPLLNCTLNVTIIVIGIFSAVLTTVQAVQGIIAHFASKKGM